MTEQGQNSYNKIKTLLSQGETYVGVPFGISMWPMLRNKRDIIVIAPLDAGDTLDVGDVALFERGDDLVLHRIVKVQQGEHGGTEYLFWGDNCVEPDGLIPCERVLGVLRTCYRGEKQIDLQGAQYRRYVKAWGALRPVRVAWKRCRAAGGRVLRKIGLRK